MNKQTPVWNYRGKRYTPPPGMYSQADLIRMGITSNRTYRAERSGRIHVSHVGGRRWFSDEAVAELKGK